MIYTCPRCGGLSVGINRWGEPDCWICGWVDYYPDRGLKLLPDLPADTSRPTNIPDAGCKACREYQVCRTCVECPLPKCLMEIGDDRKRGIAALQREGVGLAEIARRYRVPVGSIQGIVMRMARGVTTTHPEMGDARISRGRESRRPA